MSRRRARPHFTLEEAARPISALPVESLVIAVPAKKCPDVVDAAVHRPVVLASLLSHGVGVRINDNGDDSDEHHHSSGSNSAYADIIDHSTMPPLLRSSTGSSVCPLSTPPEEPNDPIGTIDDEQPPFAAVDDAIFDRICHQLDDLLTSAKTAILTPVLLDNEEFDAFDDGMYDDNYFHYTATTPDSYAATRETMAEAMHARSPYATRRLNSCPVPSTAPIAPASPNAWHDYHAQWYHVYGPSPFPSPLPAATPAEDTIVAYHPVAPFTTTTTSIIITAAAEKGGTDAAPLRKAVAPVIAYPLAPADRILANAA
ncbi:hypothetical protein SYNPS1DRAFT_28680 [Syncephalis pseudoplumigaleata]|uniref:Uncharacterized protein n=1 Tax=Syncephalis pseudoplumigaleata TaxID=1712513 RepID=A0A4V1J1M6_9FUNG|nr:hypothetical protein SYNPS1DRAFT_28680 [Syncephalis pseudoplumigaleata]|eukprot:RKP25589.1 hypothetical protein SYNPS1DRAFT_28680 [Syncephalis pseudoplumigaleata]